MLLMLLAVAGTVAAAAVTPCPGVVLASPLFKVRPGAPWCGDGAFAMAAARNEYESLQVRPPWVSAALPCAPVRRARGSHAVRLLQVVVNRPNATVERVSVTFAGGDPAGAALLNRPNSTLLHRAAYIDIRIVSDCDGAPGPWPDALIPDVDPWFGEKRNALPARVAGSNALFWVDVFVPPAVPAGNYSGTVSVELRDGAGAGGPGAVQRLTVPFALRVFNFTLAR